MYHELVPLEPQPAINKSSMFGYATSVYKVLPVTSYVQKNEKAVG